MINQVIRETAAGAQDTWLVGLVTAVFMALFLGVAVWLLSKRARAGFDEAARLPLDGNEEEP